MSGFSPGAVGAKPPRNTQWQWSQPDENDQRPEMRKPPSTRITLPVGALDDEISASRSLPQTSSCACGGKRASCQPCTATTPSTQALDGHAAAMVICTS